MCDARGWLLLRQGGGHRVTAKIGHPDVPAVGRDSEGQKRKSRRSSPLRDPVASPCCCRCWRPTTLSCRRPFRRVRRRPGMCPAARRPPVDLLTVLPGAREQLRRTEPDPIHGDLLLLRMSPVDTSEKVVNAAVFRAAHAGSRATSAGTCIHVSQRGQPRRPTGMARGSGRHEAGGVERRSARRERSRDARGGTGVEGTCDVRLHFDVWKESRVQSTHLATEQVRSETRRAPRTQEA